MTGFNLLASPGRSWGDDQFWMGLTTTFLSVALTVVLSLLVSNRLYRRQRADDLRDLAQARQDAAAEAKRAEQKRYTQELLRAVHIFRGRLGLVTGIALFPPIMSAFSSTLESDLSKYGALLDDPKLQSFCRRYEHALRVIFFNPLGFIPIIGMFAYFLPTAVLTSRAGDTLSLYIAGKADLDFTVFDVVYDGHRGMVGIFPRFEGMSVFRSMVWAFRQSKRGMPTPPDSVEFPAG